MLPAALSDGATQQLAGVMPTVFFQVTLTLFTTCLLPICFTLHIKKCRKQVTIKKQGAAKLWSGCQRRQFKVFNPSRRI